MLSRFCSKIIQNHSKTLFSERINVGFSQQTARFSSETKKIFSVQNAQHKKLVSSHTNNIIAATPKNFSRPLSIFSLKSTAPKFSNTQINRASARLFSTQHKASSSTAAFATSVMAFACLGFGAFSLGMQSHFPPVFKWMGAAADSNETAPENPPAPSESLEPVVVPITEAQPPLSPLGDEFVVEKATSVKFPKKFSTPNHELMLAATSTRVLWYLFNTYSVGVYLHPSLMKLLCATVGPDHEDSEPTKEECASMRNKAIASKTDKLIRIVPVRDTDGTHLSRSFVDQLRKQLLGDAPSDLSSSKIEQEVNLILDLFQECWPRRKLPSGTTIDFLMSNNGSDIQVFTDGVQYGPSIHSKHLCRALLRLYIGDNSALDLKDTWGKQVMERKSTKAN